MHVSLLQYQQVLEEKMPLYLFILKYKYMICIWTHYSISTKANENTPKQSTKIKIKTEL